MKCEPEYSDPTSAGKPKKIPSIVEGFITAIWIVPAVAMLVVVLFLVLGRAQISEMGLRFLTSLVYSALIGTPSAILLTWISYRFSEKFGRLLILVQSLVLIATATFGSFGAGIVIQLFGIVPRSEYWKEFWSSYPFAIVITLIVGMSITSFETMRHRLQSATLELRTKQVEQERAYKLLAEARLSSLESRIHPHFLFNTLNSIASLIPSDPKRAEDTVGKLASLLRFSLNGNQTGLVPLAQELKIVHDYLEIERTRFGTRLRYQIDSAKDVEGVRVPPLALQSLVENCVKHVVAQRPEGATIQVVSSTQEDRIRLEVIDNGPGFSLESITPEHGLGNLVSRLELLFGERGQLAVARRDETTVVTLLFPRE
jgi:two-component system, LytTR family, sensor histidine kinase AlgZ